MSNVLGRKTPARTEAARQLQVANGRKGANGRIVFRGGRYASAEQVKQALSGNTGQYLAVLDELATSAVDPRIKLDAARYLIDRVAGKPTEKVQTEQLPVTYQAMSDDQFRTLAGRIQGDGARATNGESSSDPDGDGVSADSVAEAQ